MKNVRFSNRGSIRSTPQMMQPLESRRLMSVTVGLNPMPIHTPPAVSMPLHAGQASDADTQHSGNANFAEFPQQGADSMQPVTGGFNDGPMWGQMNQGEDQSAEFQIAHAMASGSPIVITPATVGDETQNTVAFAERSATISDLYSTIGTSTVGEIDIATSWAQHAKPSAVASIDDAVTDADSTDPLAKAAQPESSDNTIAAVSAEPALPNDAGLLLASIAAPASAPAPAALDALGSVDLGLMTEGSQPALPQAAETIVSREALQSLENELQSVRLHSRQLVQTLSLDRDRAITLSHAALADDTQPAAESISGWKTYAAAVGAAIATIVYAHHDIVRAKIQTHRVFSSKLIAQPYAD